MMEIRYSAVFEAQPEGSFLVRFVDLPDVFTEGRTLEEAQFNAAETLSSMLGWKLGNGQWTGNSTAQPECA